ncbi:ribonuclease H-like domain-containing protein [Tanacetum coccineum]
MLDLLSEYGILACKPTKTPLQSKLVVSNEASVDDPLLDNFMHYPLKSHIKTAFKILRYLKGSPSLGIHVTKARSRILSKSSIEAEYKALASVISEVIWILKILKDLHCENLLPISLLP